MDKAAIYVRSSKDLHDVSCDAQESQLKKIVRDRGDVIERVFRDKALSSTRDVRPEFDEMISVAMSRQSPFKKIYCLDTSRFGRDPFDNRYPSKPIPWTCPGRTCGEMQCTAGVRPQPRSYAAPIRCLPSR